MIVVPLLAIVLAACGSSTNISASAPSSSAAASAAPPVVGNPGVTVTGAAGATPTLTIPKTSAPTALMEQTLVPGKGTVVNTGDVIVAKDVGEIWASGKVIDNSFTSGQLLGYTLGGGFLGFDKTLAGKRLGSRILLTIPAVDGYGSAGQSSLGVSGTDTLVFVIDLLEVYKPGASASGKAVAGKLPAGWPTITGAPGKEPKIASVTGVTAPTKAASKLLVKGTGAKIDSSKTLVLQIVETDIATGKQTVSTWAQSPVLVQASSVLQVADAITGQNIGSRAVVLVPAVPANTANQTAATPARVMVFDVVGQF